MTINYDADKWEGGPILAAGYYTFQIIEEPEAEKRGKAVIVKFPLNAISPDGKSKKFTGYIPIWEVGDVWKALGYKKTEEGKWHIEESELVGMQFEADIVHEPHPTKPGRTLCKIRNVVIPPESREQAKPSDIPPPREVEEEEPDDEVPF